jgi:surface protein
MKEMFRGASSFNQDLNGWDVSNVTSTQNMFFGASALTGGLSNWMLSADTNMNGMFRSASMYNEDIDAWDLSSATGTAGMFRDASSFNQSLNSWDVSSVTNMSNMFFGASAFNGDISSWDVSNVTDMKVMFSDASSFNQDIGNWRVGAVADMSRMFFNATSFDQDLSDWCVSIIPSEPSNFAVGSALSIANNPVWGTCSDPCITGLWGVTSVLDINANRGVYRAYFDTLTGGSNYRLEYKAASDTVWRMKDIVDPNQGSQEFNITPSYGTTVTVRIAVDTGGTWVTGCNYDLVVPCRPMALIVVEQDGAFCAGDSSLVRVGISGGYGVKDILWSNGSTNRRTYGQQGEKLIVTVTDAAGCSVTDSITVATLDVSTAPTNFNVTRNGAEITGTWTPAVLGSGQTLIGYRMAYRLRNTLNWTNTDLQSNPTQTIDWTGSGNPAGNYEFVVFARYDDNGTVANSNFSCIVAQGYNGVGGKADFRSSGEDQSVFEIYPNPVNDVLHIQSDEGSLVRVVDMQGRVLLEKIGNGEEMTLNTTNWLQGVYMIVVESQDQVTTKRIIKN